VPKTRTTAVHVNSHDRYPALSDWVARLPFEHVDRRRDPGTVKARWQSEFAAHSRTSPCSNICLAIAASEDREGWFATLATWILQSRPGGRWLVVGAEQEPWAERRGQVGFPPPIACLPLLSAKALRCVGIDWVVRAIAGDLLHPSLCAAVEAAARRGAAAIRWDRLEILGFDFEGKVLRERHREPAFDPVADLRGVDCRRNMAARPEFFEEWPRAEPCSSAAPTGEQWVHWAEPMGLYAAAVAPWKAESDLGRAEALVAAARRHWGAEFEWCGAELVPRQRAKCVSVLLLFRDRPELTVAAVDSVLAQSSHGRIELILVDNDSKKESRDRISAFARNNADAARVRIVELTYPGAFNHSAQCNVGAAHASGDVLLILNNDARLAVPDALDRLARWALLPGVATVGARLVDATGAVVGGGFRLRRLPGAEFNSPVEEERGACSGFDRSSAGNTFACAAIAMEVWRRLGGLDALRFPIGYNDVDFCLRATRAGLRHVTLGGLTVEHRVGASRARIDEVAQKIALRTEYPWTSALALAEREIETLPAVEATLHLPIEFLERS
jgi:GT2 family glycosyltransferase